MTLSLLITLAIVLPLVVFVVLFGFAKGTAFMARQPRLWAVVLIIFGLVYAGSALWRAADGFDTDELLFVIGGTLFVGGGVYQWFRGRSVDLT